MKRLWTDISQQMRRKVQASKTRARLNRGFTMVELMVALLIVVLLTTLVAMGIPTAFNTYRSMVKSANAQVALSTTTTILRDELSTATAVHQEGNDLYYRTADGYWACIYNPSSDSDAGLKRARLQEVAQPDGTFKPTAWSKPADKSEFLFSDKAITGSKDRDGTTALELRVRFKSDGGITYSNGVFSVKGLEVIDEAGDTLADVGEEAGGVFKVRAVNNVEEM